MLFIKSVDSILKTFTKAINDLEKLMAAYEEKTEKEYIRKENAAIAAEIKIEAAKAERRASREKSNVKIADMGVELTRAAKALEKLNDIIS